MIASALQSMKRIILTLMMIEREYLNPIIQITSSRLYLIHMSIVSAAIANGVAAGDNRFWRQMILKAIRNDRFHK